MSYTLHADVIRLVLAAFPPPALHDPPALHRRYDSDRLFATYTELIPYASVRMAVDGFNVYSTPLRIATGSLLYTILHLVRHDAVPIEKATRMINDAYRYAGDEGNPSDSTLASFSYHCVLGM